MCEADYNRLQELADLAAQLQGRMELAILHQHYRWLTKGVREAQHEESSIDWSVTNRNRKLSEWREQQRRNALTLIGPGNDWDYRRYIDLFGRRQLREQSSDPMDAADSRVQGDRDHRCGH